MLDPKIRTLPIALHKDSLINKSLALRRFVTAIKPFIRTESGCAERLVEARKVATDRLEYFESLFYFSTEPNICQLGTVVSRCKQARLCRYTDEERSRFRPQRVQRSFPPIGLPVVRYVLRKKICCPLFFVHCFVYT